MTRALFGLWGVLCLGSSVAVACGDAASSEEDSAPPALQGAELIVTVSGRGVVSSDPIALFCGNDGAQAACRGVFEFAPDDASARVKLTATPAPDWVFAGWELLSSAPGVQFTEGPEGIDLLAPALELRSERIAGDLSVRPLYSVVARFSPTSSPAATSEP